MYYCTANFTVSLHNVDIPAGFDDTCPLQHERKLVLSYTRFLTDCDVQYSIALTKHAHSLLLMEEAQVFVVAVHTLVDQISIRVTICRLNVVCLLHVYRIYNGCCSSYSYSLFYTRTYSWVKTNIYSLALRQILKVQNQAGAL